jgi:hypothetical protein
MKYYKLIESINTKEIGIYPQVIKTIHALEIQEFGLGFNEHIQKQFTLPEPILQNNARETTMISVTAINNNVFLVLKNYFIDFLKDFIIADFQSWKIDAYHKKQLVDDYSLFHLFYPSQKELVDFEKSKFKIKDSLNNISVEKKFKNFHDYHTDW